jgi:hypothetical protein
VFVPKASGPKKPPQKGGHKGAKKPGEIELPLTEDGTSPCLRSETQESDCPTKEGVPKTQDPIPLEFGREAYPVSTSLGEVHNRCMGFVSNSRGIGSCVLGTPFFVGQFFIRNLRWIKFHLGPCRKSDKKNVYIYIETNST